MTLSPPPPRVYICVFLCRVVEGFLATMSEGWGGVQCSRQRSCCLFREWLLVPRELLKPPGLVFSVQPSECVQKAVLLVSLGAKIHPFLVPKNKNHWWNDLKLLVFHFQYHWGRPQNIQRCYLGTGLWFSYWLVWCRTHLAPKVRQTPDEKL